MKQKIFFLIIPVLFIFQTKNTYAIPGFIKYRIKPGDTYCKICKRKLHYFNPELLDLIIKINRTNTRYLIPGRIIYLPQNMELARAYCPLPKFYQPLINSPRGIYINLTKQYFGAYESGKLKFWGPISSGKKGRETPTGTFKVLLKEKDKISSICGKTMYYSLHFCGDYFIHHQDLKGKPGSLGCVRTLFEDAKRLFYWTKKGDTIIIQKDTLAANK